MHNAVNNTGNLNSPTNINQNDQQTPKFRGSSESNPHNFNVNSMKGAPKQYSEGIEGNSQDPDLNNLGLASESNDQVSQDPKASKFGNLVDKLKTRVDKGKSSFKDMVDSLKKSRHSQNDRPQGRDNFPENTANTGEDQIDNANTGDDQVDNNNTGDDQVDNDNTGDDQVDNGSTGDDQVDDGSTGDDQVDDGTTGDEPTSSGSGNLWQDADSDGDADMTLVVGEGLEKDVVENAAQQIEDGSGGKLDVQVVDEAPTDGREYGTIEVSDLPGDMAGYATWGSGSEIQIDPEFTSSLRILTHEMMHASGVTEDVNVNGGDSIMDYSYQDSSLTDYDKGLLENMYGDMTAGENN